MPPMDRTRGAYILPIRSARQMRRCLLAAGCRGACTNALRPASAARGGIWPCKIVRPKLLTRADDAAGSGGAKGELAKPLVDDDIIEAAKEASRPRVGSRAPERRKRREAKRAFRGRNDFADKAQWVALTQPPERGEEFGRYFAMTRCGEASYQILCSSGFSVRVCKESPSGLSLPLHLLFSLHTR
ncbi:hypothetical protein MTO96_049587 [Rhipicephalus appendiculatus]